MTGKYLIIFSAIGLFSVVSAGNEQVFFQGDIQSKQAIIPDFVEILPIEAEPTVHAVVHFSDTIAHVSKYIDGHNTNVYMTQIITQPRLIRRICELSSHVLRYPGGNLSNMFFWDARPEALPEDIPNEPSWAVENQLRERYRGGRNDDEEALAVDNFYRVLKQTRNTGAITVNYAYARYGTGPDPVAQAAHYAADWVRYDNGRTRFWEIGNENYGAWQAGYLIDTLINQDGQPAVISGELYGKHFKIFADSMRAAAEETGADIDIGAVLLETEQDWFPPVQKTWNSGFFSQAGDEADFFIVHSYFTPWQESSSIATILNSPETECVHMMNYMEQMSQKHGVAMKPVALTEWNIFAIGSKQQVSYINGMHSVLVLGELIRNRFAMACRWNLANGWAGGNDHGMFSQNGEPGVPRFHPRPVFYYMTLFQRFFGDHMMASKTTGDTNVVVYVSGFDSGEAGIVLVNKGSENQVIQIQFKDFQAGPRCYWVTLTGGKGNGDFSRRVRINGAGPELPAGGPDLESIRAFSVNINETIVLDLPGYGTIFALVEGKTKD